MGETVVAVLVGVAAFAIVFGTLRLVGRLHRDGGERQRRLLWAGLAVALVVTVAQVAGSNGGYAVSFLVLATAWALLVCLGVLAANGVRRRRERGKTRP